MKLFQETYNQLEFYHKNQLDLHKPSIIQFLISLAVFLIFIKIPCSFDRYIPPFLFNITQDLYLIGKLFSPVNLAQHLNFHTFS